MNPTIVECHPRVGGRFGGVTTSRSLPHGRSGTGGRDRHYNGCGDYPTEIYSVTHVRELLSMSGSSLDPIAGLLPASTLQIASGGNICL
jgi:hypothetical protein